MEADARRDTKLSDGLQAAVDGGCLGNSSHLLNQSAGDLSSRADSRVTHSCAENFSKTLCYEIQNKESTTSRAR